jgi:CubicO group peptidase (beta-lactamase class C family)
VTTILDAATATLAIQDLARRELEETGVPGVAIAVGTRGGPAQVSTYGRADIAAELPVEPDTLFEIGSIGKAFTALVILQLVEEGRLDLDAPVSDVLPWWDVPVVGRQITVHDLLTHTAGITTGIEGTPEAVHQVWALRHLRPGSPPGERFHYSNVGYKALGLVIEEIDGRRYPDAVRARILEPLAMTATAAEITHDLRPRLAVGYEYLHDDRLGYPGRPIAPAAWVETATADGSIASTAEDMMAFARMLLLRGEGPRGRLVSEGSFARMAGPHIWPSAEAGYGYGLATRVVDGRTYIGHGGGMIGYLAGLQLDPAAGVAAVVLENGTMGRPVTLARACLSTLTRRGPAGDTSPTADSSQDERAGTYRRDDVATPKEGPDSLEVVAVDDGLAVRLGEDDITLEQLGDLLYLAPRADFDRYALRFEPVEGRAGVVWHGPARYVRDGVPPPAVPEPEEELAGLAGHYRSHNPWTTNFRVILRGDVLWLVFVAAPDGFEEEQPLVSRDDGSFRVGSDPRGPEEVRFDAPVYGRPTRAWLSGVAYYRVG